SNAYRMDYRYYKNIGAGIIGSGAIESAHRTVVQKRMKQSGQRWSYEGAQNMLNLRVIRMNGQWGKITKMVKTNFKRAA
ncbi:MAG TPA: ISKra4 family transposase, partial [Hanamia sp.]|nr:ISKra4 family transposase [Hanamia sp.]